MSHTTICLCYLLRLLARAGARFALPALEEPAFDEPARFAIWAAWLVASAATPGGAMKSASGTAGWPLRSSRSRGRWAAAFAADALWRRR